MSTIPKVTKSKEFVGQAPLNWCPQCGHKLETTQIKLKDNQTLDGKKCKYCHYIHTVK